MSTKKEALKAILDAAVELQHGSDPEKELGRQIYELALAYVVKAKANEKPWDKNTHGPSVKQSPDRLPIPERLKAEDH